MEVTLKLWTNITFRDIFKFFALNGNDRYIVYE